MAARHNITQTKKIRDGMLGPEFRVVCSCGYEDKAQTEQAGKVLMGKHLQNVVNTMKPQKTLDI